MNEETNQNTSETLKPYKASFKLICASKCKKYAVDSALKNRPANKFTRVSQEFLISCENALRNHIDSRIKAHPSIGKTLT